MDEIGGAASDNGSERASIKRLKVDENDDRISALPDSLIHHILSFLPSTKQAIRTGILSKRWQNQWTHVPVLIFDSTGESDTNFSQFIDRTLTLYNCSKIKKLHIQYDDELGSDPQLTSKLSFATNKDVEELVLRLFPLDDNLGGWYRLPQFLFRNSSILKLELFNCFLMPSGIIDWPCLKELKLECSCLYSLAIGNVVSGSPSLELLELTGGIQSPDVVIASKSLKRLIFVNFESRIERERIEISCPNLEELSFKLSYYLGSDFPQLPDQTIENALSRSPLLHMLELQHCVCSKRLVLASKSLKKLFLSEFYGTLDFEIILPNLEEADLYYFVPNALFNEDCVSMPRCCTIKILRQLQHVNLLEIGSWTIKILSILELEGLLCPVLNCKCLTLDGSDFDEDFPGIVCAIRSSPALENLTIKLESYQSLELADFMLGDLPDMNVSRENYCNSNWTDFNCPMSNLKTVKIIGLSEGDDRRKILFNFVEFMLKNARMLDKVVIILGDCLTSGASFLFEVSKKLLSFQKHFPHTTIELLPST